MDPLDLEALVLDLDLLDLVLGALVLQVLVLGALVLEVLVLGALVLEVFILQELDLQALLLALVLEDQVRLSIHYTLTYSRHQDQFMLFRAEINLVRYNFVL